MKIAFGSKYRSRRAVSSILAAVIMFTMLFTVLFGFLIYDNQTTLSNNQASAQRQAAVQQASAENLVLSAGFKSAADPYGQIGDLWLTINNTGSSVVTIADVYVTKIADGSFQSNSKITVGSHYLSSENIGNGGDLNLNLPISVPMGVSTIKMSGCSGDPYGCDIAISQAAYNYAPGTAVEVNVVTSSGNVFSVRYPPSQPGPTGFATNPLVLSMVATPPQTQISCTAPSCITLSVTVYNYATAAVTNVNLNPNPPSAQTTGTATIPPGGSCSGPNPSSAINPYSGGIASSVTFTCQYSASTGAVGGFASFSARATGILNGASVSSAQEVSNSVQIGGTVSVLNQGPFSANSFFFKDTYCLQSNGIFWVTPCAQTPSGALPPSGDLTKLPNANPQNASSDFYVAYYLQITNNFNTSLSVLQYSYFQTDPSLGGESDFYLVGPTSAYCPSPGSCNTGYYFPSYGSGTPTLTAYGGDALTCKTNPNNCITIAKGQTVTLTFAACKAGIASWNWGDSQYGRSFDDPLGCSPESPPNYQTPEATYLSIIISFLYNNQVYDQQIPFQGETVLGSSNPPPSCATANYCGTVFYTQYGPSGAVGYFNFVYNPAAKTFTFPNPPQVINSNLPHGSDGVVFNPNDHIIITGTNQPYNGVNEVNPNTGAATTYATTMPSYNVFVDASGKTLWADGDACPGCTTLTYATLSPTPGPPSSLTLSGDDVNLNSIMVVDSTHVYYTAELGSRFEGMTGHVGTIDLTTGKTTCFKTGGVCTVFNGVHGGVYDPYTKDLIVAGWNVINQIDPNTGNLIKSETVAALSPSGGNVFDQGAVDGFGHVFWSFASDNGRLYFEDYATTGIIGSAGNFVYISPVGGPLNNLGAAAFYDIDDLAPIVGPGSHG